MTQQYDQFGNPVPPAPDGQVPQGYYQQQPPQMMPAYQQQNAPATIDPNSVPAYLRNQENSTGNALDAGAGVGGPRLSIKGKQFRFIEGDTERQFPFGQPLNVVILAADPVRGVAKNYYGGQAYVEGADQIPVCYSSDGVTPDSGAEYPQCDTCATCPHNKFGTAVAQDGTMGKGKACRDFKRLFVVPADQPYQEVYELRVPPTSFKNMQNYGHQLDRAGLKIHTVVTTLNFTGDASPVLTFSFAQYMPEEAVRVLNERLASGEIEAVRPSLLKSPAVVTSQTALPAPGAGGATGQLPAQGNAPAVGQPQPQPVQQMAGVPNPMGVQPQPIQPVQPGAVPPPPGAQQPPAPPSAAPCPLGAPAGFRMTAAANGLRYEQFAGWNDDQLVQHGYMERV